MWLCVADVEPKKMYEERTTAMFVMKHWECLTVHLTHPSSSCLLCASSSSFSHKASVTHDLMCNTHGGHLLLRLQIKMGEDKKSIWL